MKMFCSVLAVGASVWATSALADGPCQIEASVVNPAELSAPVDGSGAVGYVTCATEDGQTVTNKVSMNIKQQLADGTVLSGATTQDGADLKLADGTSVIVVGDLREERTEPALTSMSPQTVQYYEDEDDGYEGGYAYAGSSYDGYYYCDQSDPAYYDYYSHCVDGYISPFWWGRFNHRGFHGRLFSGRGGFRGGVGRGGFERGGRGGFERGGRGGFERGPGAGVGRGPVGGGVGRGPGAGGFNGGGMRGPGAGGGFGGGGMRGPGAGGGFGGGGMRGGGGGGFGGGGMGGHGGGGFGGGGHGGGGGHR